MITKREYYANVEGFEEEYKLAVEEKDYHVFEVDVMGEKHTADFRQINESIYSLIIDNKSYSVEISEDGDQFEVLVDGDSYNVEILDDMKRLMKLRADVGLEGRQVVESQMPGYIWKTLKEVGDEVEAGEPVMILVAMKMENEIKAPKDGVIEEIFVKASEDPQESTVGTGDKLFVIE
ncbi:MULTISPECIES: biotin/lipoyl-containing protein [Flexistipes]|uniref:Acetyl-CoA carboxylase biotin carboxyl carrier protein subunit n=1 Tax=Flexistipes sinusarabici TaxID=2352 RepID=A0A5D0MS59_FLESI|nr:MULTISPECIES: biotin/lipoyl-containing protein [Flexistipes]MEC9493174.1 biotin/lipoyl-containing protein [Flexistipes sp.]TYB34811.1 MAG: acetyl-CoA carboxylase biotin carboxyl carrier protein subunit [Flexistipes sinusarabici]